MAKTILITGCNGLVGTYLTKICLNKNYNVIGVDKEYPMYEVISNKNFKFKKLDLLEEKNIIDLFTDEKLDAVLNCFGIKGSPIMAKNKPVDFLYPSIKINTEIINQCSKNDVWLVYVSSVGVYGPSENFKEDNVWKQFPSDADWYPSWSKRIGELLLESYKVQYGYDKWTIIRPANIYGEYDNYSGHGTVISTMMKKITEADDEIEAWGDGSPIRDFVFGEDVAKAILDVYERKLNIIINFGSGEEMSIKDMIKNLIKISGKKINITWDKTKPNGDLRRQMNTKRQKKYNLLPSTSFYDGLKKTYIYYNKTYKK